MPRLARLGRALLAVVATSCVLWAHAASTADTASHASDASADAGTQVSGITWRQFVAAVGSKKWNKDQKAARALYDSEYKGKVVQWSGAVYGAGKKNGDTVYVDIKMNPSDAWRADLRLLFSSEAIDPAVLQMFSSLTFQARLAKHGGMWGSLQLDLLEVVEVYDGTHDTRALHVGDLLSGDRHVDGVFGPRWQRFVRDCGASLYGNNSVKAQANFDNIWLGREVNWAGRVHRLKESAVGIVSKTASVNTVVAAAKWFKDAVTPSSEDDKQNVDASELRARRVDESQVARAVGDGIGSETPIKMRPSDSWFADLTLVYRPDSAPAGREHDHDHHGAGVEVNPLTLNHGDEVWFHGRFIEMGTKTAAHKLEVWSIHKVPDHLQPSKLAKWEL